MNNIHSHSNASLGSNGRNRIKVMLMISSLEYGGSEQQVIQLANHLNPNQFEVCICSLSPLIPLINSLKNNNIKIHIVEKKSKYDATVAFRAARLMSAERIDMVHAFLFDAEIVARLAARWSGVPIVIASERNTDYQLPLLHSIFQRLTRSLFDMMIANSRAGKRFNIRNLGIPAKKIRVIHNGVDLSSFFPGINHNIRKELGISPDDHVVGMVSNFKRQKNHEDYFRMAKRVLKRFPNTWFICVGEPLRDNLQGAEDYHRYVRKVVVDLAIDHRCLFLGNRNDMPDIYNACDVTVMTSSREGTPNALLESMACEVPVVCTNIADNAYVVPNNYAGFVEPLGDIQSIADRVCKLLADPQLRYQLGRQARVWVQQEFSIAALIRKTEMAYKQCLQHKMPNRLIHVA